MSAKPNRQPLERKYKIRLIVYALMILAIIVLLVTMPRGTVTSVDGDGAGERPIGFFSAP